VLGKLPTPTISDPSVLVGNETGDDAAIYQIDERVALVLTNDFFAPIVDDPFDYGQIAVANALSDVYAVGGRPITALNIAAFPRDLGPDVIAKILEGGQSMAEEAGILIIGGHTVDDKEPKYGLAVTGVVTPGEQITNAGAQPGDLLVLTKAIGSGFITTAAKAGTAPDEAIAAAVKSMATLNRGAAQAMNDVGVNAATDVTGFGLLGHLAQMVKASGVSAELNWSKIPFLTGALELAKSGATSGGTRRNMEALEGRVNLGEGISEFQFMVLADAQTSGGMLISVSEDKSHALVKSLIDNKTLHSSVVGRVGNDNAVGTVTINE
tara:strand:+ start:7875 stop:8846 length:972 start_codon:yes stop_codon:yes gene_type:complete